MYTREDLDAFQSEPLDIKIMRTTAKIAEWYSHFNNHVYVSFSGGKDSTVLADLCARYCSVIHTPLYLVFVNTGLEYPEIQKHVKFFAGWLQEKYGIEVNLEILRPAMRFDEVIRKHGYPLISKQVSDVIGGARRNIEEGNLGTWKVKRIKGNVVNKKTGKPSIFNEVKYEPITRTDFKVSPYCCNEMKKKPIARYEKKSGRVPIIATLAEESEIRKLSWFKTGCNSFNSKKPRSVPMSFWTEQDVLHYIKKYNIPIASVYGSVEYEEDPEQIRFEEIGIQDAGHDKLCTTGCKRTGCIFCAFGAHLEKGESRFERLKKTHPKQYEYCIGGGEYNEEGIWVPSKEGLGMGHVFDEVNKIYGEGFIKY